MLKFLYENQPKCENFVPRKLLLNESRILLFGTPLSGKTTLGLEFLQNYENSLYLDASDLRYDIDFNELCEFVKEKNIKALCIDNITKDPEILPNCETILLITTQKNLEIKGFKRRFLCGLDFEEFIAFSKNSDESTLFSHFMSAGNSPTISDENYLKYALFSRLSDLGRKILSAKTFYNDENFNALEIFRELKTKGKISKDSFYAGLKELEELGIIAFANNYVKNSRLKRVFFSNFAFKKLFCLNKNPSALIANMVFCELFKNEKAVYFKAHFDFYLPNEKTVILIMPFKSPDLVLLRVKKILKDSQDLEQIIVISNTPSKACNLGNVSVKFMNFTHFAVGLEF